MDFYTAIVLLVIIMVVVNGIDIFSNRLIGIRMKRNSLITCSLIVFALFFEWLGVKVNGVASHIEIHKLAKLLEFSIAPLIAVFATVSYSKIRHPKIITAVMTAHIVFEAVALHFGWVISVDSSGRYHRGPLYPIYILVFSILHDLCPENGYAVLSQTFFGITCHFGISGDRNLFSDGELRYPDCLYLCCHEQLFLLHASLQNNFANGRADTPAEPPLL